MVNSILPKPIERLSEALASLPGVGPKMASKLSVYLASDKQANLVQLGKILQEVSDEVGVCNSCGNLSSKGEFCTICSDDYRDTSKLLIVETPMDLVQIEKVGHYDGLYLVLGKLISPLNGIGPEDINVTYLLSSMEKHNPSEIIFALSSTVEGESTCLYLKNLLSSSTASTVIFSQLAKGLPTGVNIEYLDSSTLKGALSGRVNV